MGVDKRLDDMPDGWSESVLRQLPVSLVVSDPRQADNPIIFVNSAFEKTTGYSANEVLGQNCRFLQGEETDPADIASLREAIANQAEISLDILNYRKSGEAFINRLMISPVTSPEGELVYFIGFQYEHQDQKTYMDRARELDGRLREIQHRVKNHLSMIVSLIRIQAGRLEPRDAAAMMAKRVETIGLLYEQVDVAQRNADQTIDMAAYLDKVCGAVSGLSNEIEVELKRAEGTVYFPVEDAARLGQIVSEIVTNAMARGYEEREGKLFVRAEVGGETREYPADVVLVAVGRRPVATRMRSNTAVSGAFGPSKPRRVPCPPATVKAAMDSGVARIRLDLEEYRESLRARMEASRKRVREYVKSYNFDF